MLALLLAPVYALACFYLFRRMTGWLHAWVPELLRKRRWLIPAVPLGLLALSPLIAYLLPAGALRRILTPIGNYWLGVTAYLLLIVLLIDLLRLLARCVPHSRRLTRSVRAHRIAGCVCVLALAATTLGGVWNARIIRVTPYEITVPKQAGTLASLKVVLAADLHLGYNIGARQMTKMVEKINVQEPDLVVLAGDIFDGEWEAVPNPEELAGILRGIRARYGVYACYGNHDVEEPTLAGFTFGGGSGKESAPEMDAFLQEAGIRLLHDEGVQIAGSVFLYGRPDARRPGRGISQRRTPEEITAGLDQDRPILVLDHEPRELAELARAGVDVALGGHTHDGQLFPANLLLRLLWENSCGLLEKNGMYSIVTSGAGLFGPNMRVGTRAEICPITIHFAAP